MKIWGVAGWKNTGKTGLMERLVAHFTADGLRVSTVKHAHHSFDVDQPGKDSFRHRSAGAYQVVLASAARVAVMTELRDTPEPPLSELLAGLAPVDLVLVEGFKASPHPKLETHRAEVGAPLLAPGDPTICFVASDAAVEAPVPVVSLDATEAIAARIRRELVL